MQQQRPQKEAPRSKYAAKRAAYRPQAMTNPEGVVPDKLLLDGKTWHQATIQATPTQSAPDAGRVQVGNRECLLEYITTQAARRTTDMLTRGMEVLVRLKPHDGMPRVSAIRFASDGVTAAVSMREAGAADWPWHQAVVSGDHFTRGFGFLLRKEGTVFLGRNILFEDLGLHAIPLGFEVEVQVDEEHHKGPKAVAIRLPKS